MPKKFPAEFKRDVVRVARRGDLTVPEVAHVPLQTSWQAGCGGMIGD